MHHFYVFLMNIALFAAVIAVVSSFVMLSWNYAIPRLAHSVDSKYDKTTFTNIDYATALVTTLIAVFFFSDLPSKYYDPNSREYQEMRDSVPSLMSNVGDMRMKKTR